MHCGPPIKNFGWAMAHPDGPPRLPCSAPMGYGECYKLPQRPDYSRILLYCMLAKRIWLQHFGSLVSFAMSGEIKANPLIDWLINKSNLVGLSAGNLRHINIIVIQTGKLIFVGSKIAAPRNFVALFGRTPRTCLRPALLLDSSTYETICRRMW